MHLINNEEDYSTSKLQTTTKKKLYKYKFYNLLFNGKISMKEYLNALHFIEGNSKEDNKNIGI